MHEPHKKTPGNYSRIAKRIQDDPIRTHIYARISVIFFEIILQLLHDLEQPTRRRALSRGRSMMPAHDTAARTYEPHFLSTRQAAIYLGLSIHTLRKYRILGIGPEITRYRDSKKGHARYALDDLNEWTQQRKSTKKDENS